MRDVDIGRYYILESDYVITTITQIEYRKKEFCTMDFNGAKY